MRRDILSILRIIHLTRDAKDNRGLVQTKSYFLCVNSRCLEKHIIFKTITLPALSIYNILKVMTLK